MRTHTVACIAAGATLAVIQASAREATTEEIVVTSTALHESALQIAQPAAVIAGDELRRALATSIGETLSQELGISSSYFGPSASRPVIRGLSGERVQVLQDGMASLDVSSLSQDHAVTLESVVSQQLEILKGPATLLYGSGAAGGLVNVVSNRIPMQRRGAPVSGALELRGDTASNERTGAASIDAQNAALAVHADYFHRDTEDVSIPGFAYSRAARASASEESEESDLAWVRGRIPNTAGESQGGALGASLIGAAAQGGLAWSRYENRYGIPGEAEAFIDMRQDRYDFKADIDLDAVIDTLHLRAAYSDYRHIEFEAPGEPGTSFKQDAYELRVLADHSFAEGWRGTVGGHYVDADFAVFGEESFVPSSITRSASVFVFEERRIGPFSLEFGARAERQRIELQTAGESPERDATAVSLSSGAILNLPKEHSLSVNLTRTQRNPQVSELYADGPHLAAQRYEIGASDLDRETALTADVSLRRTGAAVNWTLGIYYNDYSNYIHARALGEEIEGLPVFAYGQAGAKFRGLEAEISLPLWTQQQRRLDLRLAGDYVRAALDSGEKLPQIPPLRFGAGLQYESGALHLTAEAMFHDSQHRTALHETPSADFIALEIDASYRVQLAGTSVLLFLRGTNLLDEQARQHTSPLKDIAPLPGRSLHVGARAEF